MIAQVLQRGFLQSSLDDVVEMIDKTHEELQTSAPGASERAAEVSARDLEVIRDAIAARSEEGLEKGDLETVYISRDPIASIVQSSLEQYFEQANAIAIPEGQGLAPLDVPVTDVTLRPEWAMQTQKLLSRLDTTDARWVLSFLAARGIAGLRKKHAFPTTPAQVTIANKSRVILVGDWGSGLPRARAVSRQMQAALRDDEGRGRERHVIHLGDVYFSGFGWEYRKRFLPHWPVEPDEAGTIGSWSLNGNHDMFSGGYGYFDVLLADPRFARQQGSSYFCLENDHWQIFGLDSAFDLHGMRGEHGDLFGPQAVWMTKKREAAPKKKTLLLSHHQLFSAYEGGGPPPMAGRVEPIFAENPATAWFWGHEHRCATYRKDVNPLVRYARIVGHGGVPVKPNDGAQLADIEYEFREAHSGVVNRFTRFGFAVLDFDDGNIVVKYVSEVGGKPHHTEVLG